MNSVMAKIQRFGKIRRFHTITSQETIKPSFPTPPHLKLHNLSLLDCMNPNVHVPFVYFYKNYTNADINNLKKSLSKSLTQYYPFAGRFQAPSATHMDCNDEGVEFLEASIDIPLHEFILKRDPDETLNQLIPGGSSPNMLEVQLNHFPCGGVAVAVSISHKVADAFTMTNFVNHWATATRGGSPLNPTFISTPNRITNLPDFSGVVEGISSKCKYVQGRFVFPNSKLSELKNKINAMGGITPPLNPTRVESLASLLYKCAVGAAAGSSNVGLTVNMRESISTICPKSAAGNIVSAVIAKMADSGQIQLNEVITSLRKERMELQGVTNIEQVGKKLIENLSTVANYQIPRIYACSSVCWMPYYKVDFGWGNPVRVMIQTSNFHRNLFILMDTTFGDGIEALVQLEEEEMALFRNDKELLAYVEQK